MTQTTMQVRQHRGGLDNSVATMKTIPATMEALREHVREALAAWGVTEEILDSIRVEEYLQERETRIPGWDGSTYLITLQQAEPTPTTSGRAVFGYCSRMVDKEVTLDPALKEHIEKLTPKPGEQLQYQMEKGREYARELIERLIKGGLAGNILETTLKMFFEHPGFEQWVKMTREERDAAPAEVKAILDETKARLEDARFAVKTLLPMVADVKGFKNMLEIMRKRGIPIYDEENTAGKYSLILRSEFGTIPLGKNE